MKIEDVQKCGFPNWYNHFEKVTVESIILPLPEGFPEYILKDGVVLPASSNPLYEVDSNSTDESDSDTNWDNADVEEAESPYFPDFDEQIKTAIDDLGGRVFPKLNWSCPQDASWIAMNASLACTSTSDIYLLLQSSEFIVHDLTQAFKDCEDYIQTENSVDLLCQSSSEFCLVLRKWVEIDPSGEFRCFVKNNNLIGISQREASVYFEHIGVNKTSVIEDILKFFKKNIQYKFPSSNYIFDVYRPKEKRVRLLDFNPFGRVTDALLFNWEELECYFEIQDGIPEFRYIEENSGVMLRRLTYHGMPRDIIDISTGEDSFKLIDLMKLKLEEEKRHNRLDSDENEDVSPEK